MKSPYHVPMGKASRTKQDPDRRARIAAQRAAEKRRQRNNRIFLAGGAIVVVVAVVVAFLLIPKGSGNSAGSSSSGPTGASLTSVVNTVTSVPASTLDKVGTGSGAVNGGSTPLIKINGGSPLTSAGKPEVVYIGAEYCPYCAAERWGMIVALSRFGTFTGLQTTRSAAKDGAGNAEPNPNTPTWTFAHAKYTSKYLAFTPVETETNIPDASTGGYTTLQTPTSAEQALITKYDAAPYVPSQSAGSIPFMDFGNKYMISGASYDGSILGGKSWSAIATALKDPSSPIAKAIDGTANYLTAPICKLTNNQPSTACTPAVKALES
jgi:thiol-disulfide isomerase/thioredoxin